MAIWLISLVVALNAALVSGQSSSALPEPLPCSAVYGATSLQELARLCPELSTFYKLLAEADGYGKWMLDCGRKCTKLGNLQRTVFVPTNTAWAHFFAATGTSLPQLTSRASRQTLQALMRYHVLPRVLQSYQVPADSSSAAGERLVTLQGDSLLLARRLETNSIRVTGRRNGAMVVKADIPIGKPVVHLVSNVLLLDPLPPPLPPQSPEPPPPNVPVPAIDIDIVAAGVEATGRTVFNLTWGRPVDMDLIVVANITPGRRGLGVPPITRTMYYTYTGPEPLIGGGYLECFRGDTGGLSGFYSQNPATWEALIWDAPKRPVEAVYTICSYFYNLEWYPGTVINQDNPMRPNITVTTDDGRLTVGWVSRPMAQWGAFSFTTLPRECSTESAWFLAQVCVDRMRRIRVVGGSERC